MGCTSSKDSGYDPTKAPMPSSDPEPKIRKRDKYGKMVAVTAGSYSTG